MNPVAGFLLWLLCAALFVVITHLFGYARRVNWIVFGLAMGANLIETRHFGWNFSAQSDVELIADMICMVILALAFVGQEK